MSIFLIKGFKVNLINNVQLYKDFVNSTDSRVVGKNCTKVLKYKPKTEFLNSLVRNQDILNNILHLKL